MGYCYADIKTSENYKGYDLFSYNCVQVSMEVLLKGVFSDVSENLREVISEESTNYRPNEVYKKTDESKVCSFFLK